MRFFIGYSCFTITPSPFGPQPLPPRTQTLTLEDVRAPIWDVVKCVVLYIKRDLTALSKKLVFIAQTFVRFLIRLYFLVGRGSDPIQGLLLLLLFLFLFFGVSFIFGLFLFRWCCCFCFCLFFVVLLLLFLFLLLVFFFLFLVLILFCCCC